MSDINCTIVLTVFDINTNPQFSYCCTASSTGWQVGYGGSIHPPVKKRIVQFRLGFPSGPTFTGFQIGSINAVFPERDQNPWYVEPESGITLNKDEAGSPPTVTVDLTQAAGLLKYQLAVDGSWDEPKIYDDGSE